MSNPSIFIIFTDQEFGNKAIPLISSLGYECSGSASVKSEKITIDVNVKSPVVLYETPKITKKWIAHVKRLIKPFPVSGIIAVVDKININALTNALNEGVTGFLHRVSMDRGLGDCIRKISEGGIFIDQAFTEVLVDLIRQLPLDEADRNRELCDTLSLEEQELFRMMAAGNSTRQMAFLLSLSEKEVEKRRKSIFKATGFLSQSELVQYAKKLRIVNR